MKGHKNNSNMNEGYTVNVDIFAFGMVIYELLALKQPYNKEPDVLGVVMKGLKPELPSLDSRYNEIIEIHKSCIEFNPSDRPNSKELMVKLSNLVQKTLPKTKIS